MKTCLTPFHKFPFISLCAHAQRLAAEQARPCHPCHYGAPGPAPTAAALAGK